MAILSEYQYMARLNPTPKSNPMIRPLVPPTTSPIKTKRPPRAAISTQVLTLFTSVPSFSRGPPLRSMRPRTTLGGPALPGPADTRDLRLLAKVSPGTPPPGPALFERPDDLRRWATPLRSPRFYWALCEFEMSEGE